MRCLALNPPRMSDETKKKNRDTTPPSKTEENMSISQYDQALYSKKKIRSILPLGMRVVVNILDVDNTTDGGLYLPENAKSNMSESVLAEVLEVASAIDDETDEETNISGIPLGAVVLIERTTGIKVPWNESLRIVDSKDILAMVEEVDVL